MSNNIQVEKQNSEHPENPANPEHPENLENSENLEDPGNSEDLENSEKVHIKIGDKKIRYYPMDDSTELVFSSTGPKMIKVNTRLAFEPWMGKEMQYRIQIIKDQVIHGTYFFLSEKSDQSIVMENKEVVPGKWKSIDILVPEGEHRYTVKLLDSDMKIYIRSMEYEIK